MKLFGNIKLKLEFTIKATLPKPETVLNYGVFLVSLTSFLETEKNPQKLGTCPACNNPALLMGKLHMVCPCGALAPGEEQ